MNNKLFSISNPFMGIAAILFPGQKNIVNLWIDHHIQVLQGCPLCELCVLSCCGWTVIAVGWLVGGVDPWCWVPCWAATAELVPSAAGFEAQP